MAKKGFVEIAAEFQGSGMIVRAPHFRDLLDFGQNLRRASEETHIDVMRNGVTPEGFYIKCRSEEDAKQLWQKLEPRLLETGHHQSLRLHHLAGLAFKHDPEAYEKVMAIFDHASPLDPRFDQDAPVIADDEPAGPA
jgi:hypothetical protein